MGMGNLAKMAQQMQAEMAKVQAEIETMSVETTAGGGAVTAVVNGHGEVLSLTIASEADSEVKFIAGTEKGFFWSADGE